MSEQHLDERVLEERVLSIWQTRRARWLYRMLGVLIRLAGRFYLRTRLVGAERLKTEGAFIIAPVHRSNLDAPLVNARCPRQVRSLAKAEMFKSPVGAWISAMIGSFPVHRGAGDRRTLQAAIGMLQRGEPLLVFPEGTRHSGGQVGEIFGGAAFLAARSGAPILPVGIAGTEEAMPPKAKFLRPAPVSIVVGEPLLPPETRNGRLSSDQRHEFTNRLREAMQAAMDEAVELQSARRGRRKRSAGALLAAALIAAGCSSAADAPSAPSAEPAAEMAEAVPTAVQPASGGLAFQDCGQAYLCAELEVPADHGDPGAATATLELGLLPAGDPDRRIGVLLVNPGGPGGDMNSFLEFGAGLSQQVLERFDVVGWNPRGVRGSIPHGCRAEAEHLMLLDPVPDTPEEQAALDKSAREAAEACMDGLGAYARLIGTEQTVIDMDSIRQALGEEQISYLGYSYGSLLGLHYAERFGSRARAIVLDGVMDPALDLAGQAVGQVRGFERVIDDIFDACRQDRQCPVSGDPEDAYNELAGRVEADPLLDADGGAAVGPAELVLALVLAAYSPEIWPIFHQGLAAGLEGDGGILRELALSYLESVDHGSFISIGCSDTGRLSPAELDSLIRRLEEEAGDFGRASASSVLPCLYWADTEPLPVGPISAPDAPGVLVLGNRGDNSTPYEWAVAVAEALENGLLLTYNGQGHTSYGRHPCVDGVVDSYLIDLALPDEDVECGGTASAASAPAPALDRSAEEFLDSLAEELHFALAEELEHLAEVSQEWNPDAEVSMAIVLPDETTHGYEDQEPRGSASAVKPLWAAAALESTGVEAVEPLAHAALALSDNSAGGRMIDLAGGVDAVNSWTSTQARLPDTRLEAWRFDDPNRVAGDFRPENPLGNRTTMADLALFYARLRKGELLGAGETAALQRWLLGTSHSLASPRSLDGVLLDRLPPQVAESSLHKAGWLPPNCCSAEYRLIVDAGLIVLADRRWFALAIVSARGEFYDLASQWVSWAACRIYAFVAEDREIVCDREGDGVHDPEIWP